MGKHLTDKRCASVESSNPGCAWNILQIIKYHHWRHCKKRLAHKRRAGGRHVAGVGNPGNDANACSNNKMQKQNGAEMDHCILGEKMTRSSPAPKSSVKARIKALISEEMSKKNGRHHPSSTYPVRLQLQRSESIHHLEPSDNDTLADIVLDCGSPRTVQQKHIYSSSTSTSDSLPLESCEHPITSDKGFEAFGNMFMGEYREDNQIDEYQEQPIENHTLFVEKMDNTKQDMLEQKLVHAEELTADALLHRKEFLDTLDIINVNNNLLLQTLQDPGSPLAHHFRNQQAFSAKIGLTKCGSFPLPDSSGRRGSGAIKHMQEQIGDRAKEKGKLQIGSQSQKSIEFRYSRDFAKQSMPSKAGYEVDEILKSSQKTDEILNNPVVIKRFKDLKQKIQHVIKENRKERHRITMDAILHKIPRGHGLPNEWKKEILSQLKDPAVNIDGKGSPGGGYESDYSVASLSKGRMRHMRRTSSLKESMDRYCQLYETSFNTEAKQRTSESSKLITGEASSPSGSTPKFLARVHSLPDLKSYIYPSGDSSDAFSSGMTRIVVDGSTGRGISSDIQRSLDFSVDSGNQLQLDTLVGSKIEESLIKIGEINSVIADEVGSTPIPNNEANAKVGLTVDNFGNLTAGDIASHNEDIEEDIGPIKEPIVKLEELIPVSLSDSNFVKGTTFPEQFSIAEDIEPNVRLEELVPVPLPDSIFLNDTTSLEKFSMGEDLEVMAGLPDRLDNLAEQRREYGMDTPKVAADGVQREVVEPFNNFSDYKILHLEVDAKDKAEFDYVRDVLELSGFSGNESLGTWHPDDQPVNPLVYEEVEGCLLLDPDCSGNEGGNCSHLLLFDLINEVLMEMFGRSYSYCPIPLSSLSHIRPMPAGHRVLKEVWTLISWYLSSRPDVNQSPDYFVSRDLANSDGWMNLQFDAECVGLELEDLIFDDLLEEVF